MGYYPNLELKTYLAPSTVCNGVGVFSLVSIPKDTIIFKPSAMTQKVSWDKVSPEIEKKMRELSYYDKDGFWIDDSLDRLGHQYYINHSHEPNVSYNYSNNCLYAMVDIEPGVELLDYYYPEERDWHT